MEILISANNCEIPLDLAVLSLWSRKEPIDTILKFGEVPERYTVQLFELPCGPPYINALNEQVDTCTEIVFLQWGSKKGFE